MIDAKRAQVKGGVFGIRGDGGAVVKALEISARGASSRDLMMIGAGFMDIAGTVQGDNYGSVFPVPNAAPTYTHPTRSAYIVQ